MRERSEKAAREGDNEREEEGFGVVGTTAGRNAVESTIINFRGY